MTAIQKDPDNPIAHLSREDIEQIGRELDAIRQEVLDTRGEEDAAYIRGLIDTQRKLELGSRGVLLCQNTLSPPALNVLNEGVRYGSIDAVHCCGNLSAV